MGEELKTLRVHGSVAEATARLRELVERRGVAVLASIDHAAGARAAGLDLADEVVVFFGDPAVGTRVMQDDPRAGIDLPLRMLVWDDNGSTYISYRDPHVLSHLFDLDIHRDVPAMLSGFMERLARDLSTEQ
jgi:uncharacterized protein (DUF302 family)